MPAERVFVGGEPIEVVGTDERVDPEWEARNAAMKREAWEREQPQRAALRNARRELMRPGDRLDLALRLIGTLQGGRVRQVESGSASADEPIGPPEAESLDVERHLRVIVARIRQVEAELDAYLGVAPAPLIALMRSDQKDSLICSKRFEGMSCEDLHDAMPELGSPKMIRRIRSIHGLRSDGAAKPVPKGSSRTNRAA